MAGFRLEHLLKYNRSIEETRAVELAAELKIQSQIEQEIVKLQTQVIQQEESLKNLWQFSQPDIEIIKVQNLHIEHLKEQINNAKQVIEKQSQKVNEAREKLLRAKTKKKVVEHLKQKFIAQQKERQLKIDRDNLDEVSTNRYIFQQQHGDRAN